MKPIIPITAAIALTFGAAQAIHAADDAHSMQHGAGQSPAFDQVDADGDGQISREEAAAAGLDLDWTEADQDGTGFLTRDEYDSAVGAGGAGEPGGLETDPGMGTEPGLGTDPGADPGGFGSDPSAPGAGGGIGSEPGTGL